ncbi:MAG: FAD-binding protein [Legionella sp.]|uniref:FAD-binding protein n=1 Tax=Legionella sp. TaxID=459 RepID=UPI0039E328FF
MLPLEMQWNLQKIAQCKQKLGRAMLNDEHSLALYYHDFGKLAQSRPAAICEPTSKEQLQELISYAYKQRLPITIRGNGMSQSGQSLAAQGGLVLSMKHFNRIEEPNQDSIWIEANASWAGLLARSLKYSLVPYVVPYNCDLSIGGVLSVGGIGASSFQYGSATMHVRSLEVIQANGELVQVDAQSPLMQACLGGQGRFGLITRAEITLRPCKPLVRTFFLMYEDKETWLHDLHQCQNQANFIESFCTSAMQGTRLTEKGRTPFAQWFYALHMSIEYEQHPPELSDLGLSPWKLTHVQEESIHSYLQRNESRFNAMKTTGQWEQAHPWYECFIPGSQIQHLEELLINLPLYYAPVVHIVAIANHDLPKGFLMLPEDEEIFAMMILNPGLPKALVPGSLETIKKLDMQLLSAGGKRYLSGFLGESLDTNYWKQHFGARYFDWHQLKETYDPHAIFRSMLHLQ